MNAVVEVTEFLPDTGWGDVQYFSLDTTDMTSDLQKYMLPKPDRSQLLCELINGVQYL